MKRQDIIEISIGILCLLLLAGYIWLGSELRYMLSELTYHRQLLDMVLQGKSLGVWLMERISFQWVLPGHGGILALGFFVSCLITGVLAWALLGKSLDFGPTVCLFGFAAAIVPTLMIAAIFWPDGRGHIESGLLLSVGMAVNVLLALLGLVFHPTSGNRFSDSSEKGGMLWNLAFFIPLVLLAFCTFINGSTGIKGYDALSYHLPLSAAWAKSGRLTTGFDIQYFYPGNMGILLRWIFAGFNDNYAFVVPFISGLMAVYLVYMIGRAIGQSRQAALVAASLAATFPVLVGLSTEACSDVMAAMLMLLGTFFVLRWVQGPQSMTALACSGLAVGLAAGTDMSILLQAAVMAVMVLLLVLRDPNAWIEEEKESAHIQAVRRLKWKWLAKHILFFGVPTLAGASFWYIRNAIRQGSLFYPLDIMGLPGILLRNVTPAAFGLLVRDNLLGGAFVVLVIPALLFRLLLRRHSPEDVQPLSARLIYFLAIAAFLTSADAFRSYLRYGCFAFLLLYVVTGDLWQRNKKLILRLTVYATFVIMTVANCEFLIGDYLYQYLFKDRVGAARFYMPQEIDSLAPGRIFNATAGSSTYGLMGVDHRHEVVSLFREAVPQDLLVYRPDYVYLKESQEQAFTAVVPMVQIASIKDSYGAKFTLWKVTRPWGISRPE